MNSTRRELLAGIAGLTAGTLLTSPKEKLDSNTLRFSGSTILMCQHGVGRLARNELTLTDDEQTLEADLWPNEISLLYGAAWNAEWKTIQIAGDVRIALFDLEGQTKLHPAVTTTHFLGAYLPMTKFHTGDSEQRGSVVVAINKQPYKGPTWAIASKRRIK